MIFRKKECVAMLLAGGQGSRLYALTKKVAKPAVRFGGKYRIIDFPLSNCVNSGIDTVGVLTQYQPLVLNEYIGNGLPWDLDRAFGGVKILPPYQGQKSYHKPAIVADTHCIRICGRLGFYPETLKDPYKVELILSELAPPEKQSDFCHRIVQFGRDVCSARSPKCLGCPLGEYCKRNQNSNK